MSEIKDRASFEIIRYANCWEDAEVLVSSLDIQPGQNCLSIASGGDNSFALLACDPALVVAADISPAQLAVVELKRAAMSQLEHSEYLGFVGFRPSTQRAEIYRSLAEALPATSRAFFDAHPEIIPSGLIHAGKFERYFGLFRRWVLPLIHSQKTSRKLLAQKSEQERKSFYRNRWDTWRWRLVFQLFFSRFVMGRLGRDPEFFRYVEANVGRSILRRVEYALTMLPGEDNPYMHYILTGEFGERLPFYARAENYEVIRARLDRLQVFNGPINTAAETLEVRFDACNLSDIFEYMDDATFASIAGDIIDGCNVGARLSYWNMLAHRQISEILPESVQHLAERSDELFRQDRAFFYRSFAIDQVL